MKVHSLLLFLPFLLCLSSCREESFPMKEGIDMSFYYDLGGNEVATCMLPSGENNLVFIQSSSVSYHLLLIDKWGDEISRKEYPASQSHFVAENMIDMDGGNFILVGALDGRPAYCVSDTSAAYPLQFQTLGQEEGRFFDIVRSGNDFFVCGQLEVDNDWQVVLGKIDGMGQFTDTLTFGTGFSDGGIDLMVHKGKLHLLAFSYGLGKGDRDFWVMNIGTDLQPSNQKTYGGSGYDQPEYLLAAKGAIYACGHTTSFGDPMHDAYLLCLEEDLSLRWEKNVVLDGHEGADELSLLHDGNIAWCSYGALPVDIGYYAVMTPEGRVLYQRKLAEYERFFRMRAYNDHLLLLGSSFVALGRDIGLRSLSPEW